jgi:hypothetical protein
MHEENLLHLTEIMIRILQQIVEQATHEPLFGMVHAGTGI